MTFDIPDGLSKEGVLSNLNMSVTKGRQQRGSNGMIWAGLIEQIISK